MRGIIRLCCAPKLRRSGWGSSGPRAGVPVEHPPIAELRKALAGFAHRRRNRRGRRARLISRGVTMGAGFRALLVKLLGRIGMLMVDPLDPQLRNVGAPFMAEALAAAPDLKSALLARNKELAAAGYHAQVNIEANSSLFFLLEKASEPRCARKMPSSRL